jgi:MFS superfamily sulfate permease-like transporter
VAIVIILMNNLRIPFKITLRTEGDKKITVMTLSEDVTFLNKASILTFLSHVADDSILEIDASQSQFIHHDIIEIIEDFKINVQQRGIKLTVIELTKDKQIPKLSEIESTKG